MNKWVWRNMNKLVSVLTILVLMLPGSMIWAAAKGGTQPSNRYRDLPAETATATAPTATSVELVPTDTAVEPSPTGTVAEPTPTKTKTAQPTRSLKRSAQMGSADVHICYVDPTATSGNNNGSSWPDAYLDLQSALHDSACTDDGNGNNMEIHVAEGTYYATPQSQPSVFDTFEMFNGVKIIGGYQAGGADTPDPTKYPSILDGTASAQQPPNVQHVVTAGDPNSIPPTVLDSSAALDGFTIQNGMAQGDQPMPGGGITITDSSPTLSNLVVTNNYAGSNGGGLFITGNSSPAVTNVMFKNNTANNGGGAYISVNTGSTPILKNVTFGSENPPITNNGIAGGGGLYINDGNVNLINSTIDTNATSGGDGAGIYVNGGNLDMQDSLVKNNSAFGGNGGGVFIGNSGSATIRDSNITNNSAGMSGGGLYVVGSVVMVKGSVSQNIAQVNGGGIELDYNNSADFVNLVVDQNQAPQGGDGGGINLNNGTATFSNLLLTNNSAWNAGGMELDNSSNVKLVNATLDNNTASSLSPSTILVNDSSLSITNTIVWEPATQQQQQSGQQPTPQPTIVSLGSTIALNNSLEWDGCPASASCTNLDNSDPKFVNEGNGDYRLLGSSPAIDKGDTSALPADTYDLDGDGNTTEPLSQDLRGKPRLAIGGVDIGAYEAMAVNINWTEATELTLSGQGGVDSGSLDRYLDLPGQSQWFKFAVTPDSKLVVTLTNLGANYDLSLYTDISQAYQQLSSTHDLEKLSAEFAPDTFSPDTFSPDTFSPDTFSPDTFSPDTFSPDTFSPDTFSPDTFSPDTFSPDTFSPDTFSPDTFSPDTFSPDTFSTDKYTPDTFSPDTFSPDTFSPDMFSSAQTRSLIAVSAHDGTQGEGILVNTWTRSGYFYVRVRGRNGAFAPDVPFHLAVTLLNGDCGSVSPVLAGSHPTLDSGPYQTLILTNTGKMVDSDSSDLTSMGSNLETLASQTNGLVVDLSTDPRVQAADTQAQANPACVYAMNVEAGEIKDLINSFWKNDTSLEYIVLVGNDHAIPFFRYPDNALLASETDFAPPVLDNTTSQASLKSGYFLSQDAYGSAEDISFKAGTIPVPDLAVGRLVETAADINHVLEAYLNHSSGGVVSPTNALVTGYDFLADDADAVRDQLQASLGSANVSTLIMDNKLSPESSSAWTATDLQNSLLGSRHDIVFLAGHFSASSALAADYKTRLLSTDVLNSSTDFTNTLVYSAGCHSGYNIVNADDVPGVTQEPDWAQVFAQKGATFIGGTGYQYGDTDFIAYSEQLYLDFTLQLRYGSGPVAVGQALVKAKQAYLAAIPEMRGIHEKALLEASLFGLPMMQYDLPGRTTAPVDTSVVTSTTGFTTKLGTDLGLRYADLHVAPTFSTNTVAMQESNGSGGSSTVTATYLSGPSGIVTNPAEPVLPLDMLNVTYPDSASPGDTTPANEYVLRGVGWRGGSYSSLTDILPLTGAATEDLRAPHMPFYSDTFYPVRPWNVNYFDALSGSGNTTRLAVMPAQYRSASTGALTGILRRFDNMDFRLYYSSNITTYVNNNWSNTPALSASPDISDVASTLNTDGTVSFEITVTGDPAAGIQAAWIVYTFEDSGQSGKWIPLDLTQDKDDSRLWKGTLDLGGASAASLRFAVEAVNGVSLVTMMTNQGSYYQIGVDPAALPQGQQQVKLNLEAPAASGTYGSQQDFSAILTQGGSPLSGLPVTFTLGGLGQMAVTGSDGRAKVSFYLAARPDDYTLDANFAGNSTYASADANSGFTITPASSALVLGVKNQNVSTTAKPQFTATVTSSGLPLVGKSVALTLQDSGSVTQYSSVAVTDFNGQATWQLPAQNTGTYTVNAWFGMPVSTDLDLSTPYYTGSSDSTTLTVMVMPDLHVTANDKTITYGNPTPLFDYSFTQSDFVNGHGPETVSGISCSAGNGPFTHAASPYAITCSGGTSSYYNLVYLPGKLTVNPAPLVVRPNPFVPIAQYSDQGPASILPAYSGWVNGDNAAVLTTVPTCSTTRTIDSPAGIYPITCAGGSAANYTLLYLPGIFTVTPEDAYMEYAGDNLVPVNNNLNLRVSVWDSAAAGYPTSAANPETKPAATIGDITKIWVQFNIYPESTCGTSTNIAPIYVKVSDGATLGDGIGTASAVVKADSETTYCVIARLVSGNDGGVNQYYTAPDAQTVAISFYQDTGKFAAGGGWIADPNGSMGNFSFVTRADSKGKPAGQLVYTYQGSYNGIAAFFIIRSNSLTALQFTGSNYPVTGTLQGKCTIEIIRAYDSTELYSDSAATFKSVIVDTNKSPSANNDSFALTVWDKNGSLFKNISTTLLRVGNVIIRPMYIFFLPIIIS
ncbi:MAG TPA: MBG domain-containing protein [Anaerolineales bacterium]|nr:MBG domain-containing protein [Anaerolineales bacterium]